MDFIFVGADNAWNYIRNDWHSNRVRFCAEVFAWACSVTSALISVSYTHLTLPTNREV